MKPFHVVLKIILTIQFNFLYLYYDYLFLSIYYSYSRNYYWFNSWMPLIKWRSDKHNLVCFKLIGDKMLDKLITLFCFEFFIVFVIIKVTLYMYVYAHENMLKWMKMWLDTNVNICLWPQSTTMMYNSWVGLYWSKIIRIYDEWKICNIN